MTRGSDIEKKSPLKALPQLAEAIDDAHPFILLQISMQHRGISLYICEVLLKLLLR